MKRRAGGKVQKVLPELLVQGFLVSENMQYSQEIYVNIDYHCLVKENQIQKVKFSPFPVLPTSASDHTCHF